MPYPRRLIKVAGRLEFLRRNLGTHLDLELSKLSREDLPPARRAIRKLPLRLFEHGRLVGRPSGALPCLDLPIEVLRSGFGVIARFLELAPRPGLALGLLGGLPRGNWGGGGQFCRALL